MARLCRRFCKWTLTALLALVLALEIASVWWTFHWQRGHMSTPSHVLISVERGEWEIFWRRKDPSYFIIGSPFGNVPQGFSVRHADDFGLGRTGHSKSFIWTGCEFTPRKYGWSWGRISVPLTYPILALALPTGWLWLGEIRRRNKVRTGCCRKCGYDLHGLEDVTKKEEGQQTRCPECGAVAPSG